MNAYLFLDIDGVLNPYKAKDPLGDDWDLVRIGQYYVWASPNYGTWLQGLIDRGVTIVWATTWVETPNMLAALCNAFGIDHGWPCIDKLEWDEYCDVCEGSHTTFASIGHSAPRLGNDCGKRPGIQRYLAEHGINPKVTPCLWVDDCLGFGDRQWGIRSGITMLRPLAHQGIVSDVSKRYVEDSLGLAAVV